MSDLRKFLTILYGAIGTFLAEEGGHVPVPVVRDERQPDPPLPAAAAASTPAADVEEDLEPPPSELDLQNPRFPRAKLEKFLRQRGYADVNKQTQRPALVDLARVAAAAMLEATTPPAPKPQATVVERLGGLEGEIAALPPATQRRLAGILSLEVPDAGIPAAAAAILVNREALDALLQMPQEPDAAPVAVAVAPAVPLVSEPLAAKPVEPAALADAPAGPEKRPTAADLIASGMTLAQACIRGAADALGYQEDPPGERELLNYVVNPKHPQIITQLAEIMRDNRADPFTVKYFARMAPAGAASCGGDCLRCPRGAAQTAICALLIDTDFHPDGQLEVIEGRLTLLVQPPAQPFNYYDDSSDAAKFEAASSVG